jgi:pyridoxamine 5'-phosphate oxidase
VLLKGVDARGFLFFTNYQSRKGAELAARPAAALLFHWVELERQVRIEGAVSKAAPEESDAYFATRPHLARLGAWASPQSRVIPDREWLEQELAAARERFAAQASAAAAALGRLPRRTDLSEFWQGRASRLRPPPVPARRCALATRAPARRSGARERRSRTLRR